MTFCPAIIPFENRRSKPLGLNLFFKTHLLFFEIQQNLEKTKLSGGRIVKSDVQGFLKRDTASYDLIFADPPYWQHHGDKDHIGDLLASGLVAARLKPDGCFVAEISAHQASPDGGALSLIDRREYGGSAVLLYAHPANA